MIDAFLVFMLVSIAPIAFLALGERGEHALFVAWRPLQLVTLFAAGAYTLYQLARHRKSDLAVLALGAVGVGFVALSYSGIAWDAQIEYHRVLLLADHYGSLTNGYRHGLTNWILGYPPGASLSVMWYRLLHLRSPNFAQQILLLLWSASLMARYMRNVDVWGKLALFTLLGTMHLFLWHVTFFYNNLFYALVWAQFILVPMFGASLRPFERCAYALVLVWLRPQWQMAAIPIGLGALAEVLAAPRLERRHLRDVALTTLAALVVAWSAAAYWQRAAAHLDRVQAAEKNLLLDSIQAHQDDKLLRLEVDTKPVEEHRPEVPALISRQSWEAMKWAYAVTEQPYVLGLIGLALAPLLGLALLGRRGLVFLVPLLNPLAVFVGTAVFARSYPAYRANAWAVERLQIIIPILAAGCAAALHYRVRLRGRGA